MMTRYQSYYLFLLRPDDLIKISTEIKLYSKDTGLNVSSFTEAFGNYAKDVSSDLAAYEESSPVVKELP